MKKWIVWNVAVIGMRLHLWAFNMDKETYLKALLRGLPGSQTICEPTTDP